jgi:hypothetical protein
MKRAFSRDAFEQFAGVLDEILELAILPLG